MPAIGLTLGDPKGIGPEVVLKTLNRFDHERANFKLFVREDDLNILCERWFQTMPSWVGKIACDNALPSISDVMTSKARAEFSLEALRHASVEASTHELESIVTGPIDKAIIRHIEPDFTGHTEYLAHLADSKKTVMLLDNGDISVALLTNHIPVREIPKKITAELIYEVVNTLREGLRRHFSKETPMFAMTSLNPHAGEIVASSEEENILIPALKHLQSQGIAIEGPYPADSFFPTAKGGNWDVVISPYHDQGLVAVKYPGIDKVVNITLGLPYLRLSPGHGVGYDIFDKGVARPESFERALEIAITRRLR